MTLEWSHAIPSAPEWRVMLAVPDDPTNAPVINDCPVPRKGDPVIHGGSRYLVVEVVWHLTPDVDDDPRALFTPWAQVVLELHGGGDVDAGR